MAWQVPSRAEVEARLDRATRSVPPISLPPSAIACPLPSLAELASTSAGSSPSRCRTCRSGMLRGAKTLFCMSCGASQPASYAFQKFSFRSSLALKRFLESVHLSSMNTPSDVFDDATEDAGYTRLGDAVNETDAVDSDFQWSQTDMCPGLGRQDMGLQSTSEQITVSTSQDISGTSADIVLNGTNSKEEFQVLPRENFSSSDQRSTMTSKLVESLVAQMPDLSFMLLDSVSTIDSKARKWREDS